MERESPTRTPLNPVGPSNFHIQLVAEDESLSAPVSVADYISLVGPFGTPDADFMNPTFPDGYHINLQTVRIPINAFLSDDVSKTRGIRLTFDDTPSGKIYVTNFRGSTRGTGLSTAARPELSESVTEAAVSTAATSQRSPRIIEEGNVIEHVQFVPATSADVAAAVAGVSGTVRLNVRTQTPMSIGDELPTMFIGLVACDGSYVDGSTQRMVFECPAQDLLTADGQPITVRGNPRTIRNFGTFSTAMMH